MQHVTRLGPSYLDLTTYAVARRRTLKTIVARLGAST
jgi:hypothetical protein